MSQDIVLNVSNLKKSYDSVIALANVSFDIEKGEIFGIVGPNGAGKTSLIECVEGLREPDGGSITMLGYTNPGKDNHVQKRIGVQLQNAALPARIKVHEAVSLFASFHQKTADISELLVRLGLEDSIDKFFCALSGGQKQRLFIVLALLHRPELVFLDELTTGLDPQARHGMWELVRDIRDQGKSILLTTHNMDEAQSLCDRIAILDQGHMIEIDTPANLIKSIDGQRCISFVPSMPLDIEPLFQLHQVSNVERKGTRIVVWGRGDRVAGDVVKYLASHRIEFSDLQTTQPNMEDVFLSLTGHRLTEQG